MLLIAQPKSASTALACTIGKITGLNIKLGIPRTKESKDCQGFKELQRYHCNMIQRDQTFLKQVVTGSKTLFKEHLLPTDKHLRILENFKHRIVILLRNPEHSYDSYKRLLSENNKNCNEGLLKDLADFHNRWMWWASNKPNVTLVYYDDLILNYNGTMKRLLRHYKIGGKIIPLMKKKYTGIGEKRVIDRTA